MGGCARGLGRPRKAVLWGPDPAHRRPFPQVYVQHLLKRDKEHLWKLIHEGGAHIYVCG
jgi:hypothetical protein